MRFVLDIELPDEVHARDVGSLLVDAGMDMRVRAASDSVQFPHGRLIKSDHCLFFAGDLVGGWRVAESRKRKARLREIK